MEDAGPDEERPTTPDEPELVLAAPPDTTEWIVNWNGILPVLLVLVIGVVAWRWLDGVGVSSDDDGGSIATETTIADEVAPTTTSAAVTTTLPVPTTVATTSTTVVSEPRVMIRGEVGPCNFSNECLIAGFEITGFDEHPGSFRCIYPNSERERSFSDDDVDVACVTADDGDTITIEVAGVRSATISEDDLDGTG